MQTGPVQTRGFTTTVKGADAKGRYTDTNKNQAMISIQDLLQHTANSWFNSLTAQQKAAHNMKVRAKEAAARIPSTTVVGMNNKQKVQFHPSAQPSQ
jgi:hypothetical protein